MKYLKRFNENNNNYSSYDDVIDVLEEVKSRLETSLNYNVYIEYRFIGFRCQVTISPVGWFISTDDDKKKYLYKDLLMVEEMVKPYLSKDHETTRSSGKVLRFNFYFNLFCKKCQNKDLTCQSCGGKTSVKCGCCNDGYEQCPECLGNDDDCTRCNHGVITCEWCSGSGETQCNACDGEGYFHCDHSWL
jgi:hypothetical protein